MATAIIDLFKGVGDDNGITVDAVKDFINANKNNDLIFNIDTMGGNLSNAITIHNLIKLHPKKTTAKLVGMTASAGTVIAMGCDEVEMYDNVLFLIHNGMMKAQGNKFELQAAAADLDKNDKIMERIYSERTGQNTEVIADVMRRGDWLTAEEAKELGFVDSIIRASYKIAASAILDNAKFNKLNQILILKLESKMNIFNKKNPVKAEMLPDGDYILEGGQKIVVKGGIAETVPAEPVAAEPKKEEEEPAAATAEQLVAAVTEVVNDAISAVEKKINARIDAMVKETGAHQPAKGTVKSEVKKGNAIEQAQAQVQEVVAGIRKGIVESRKS